MHKLLLALVLIFYIPCQLPAQINNGKEDCGPLVNNWIEKLETIKSEISGELSAQNIESFRNWIVDAQVDIGEGRFEILKRPEVMVPFYTSVISYLHQGTPAEPKPISGYYFNTDPQHFFSEFNKAAPREQQDFHAMSFLFRVYSIEMELQNCIGKTTCKPWEGYEKAIAGRFNINDFYKYLLDIVEYGKEDNPGSDIYNTYAQNQDGMKTFTGLQPPHPMKNSEEYLRFFGPELLYAFARYNEYLVSQHLAYPITQIPYAGTLGPNRYTVNYYRLLLARVYRTSLETLIQHLVRLRSKCSGTNLSDMGSLTFETSFQPVPQQDAGEIPGLPYKITAGKGRLLVEQRTASGKYFDPTETIFIYAMPSPANPSLRWVAGGNVNRYVELDPGTYFIRSPKPAKDSMVATINFGGTTVVKMPPKGSLAVRAIGSDGKEIGLTGYRIEILKQNRNNSYQLDTIFFDVWNNSLPPREMNAGLYRVGIRLPEKYYPVFLYAPEAVEVKPNTKTQVILYGFGDLLVRTFNGTGAEVRNMRIDVFTKEKNSKTKEYTHLTRTTSFDTLHMRPGHYRLQIDYPFPVIREVEIMSDGLIIEPVDNLGSITISNGKPTKEIIEVMNNETKKTISVRNNSTIDVEEGTYTVKIPANGSNVAQQRPSVKVKPGMVTTVNW